MLGELLRLAGNRLTIEIGECLGHSARRSPRDQHARARRALVDLLDDRALMADSHEGRQEDVNVSRRRLFETVFDRVSQPSQPGRQVCVGQAYGAKIAGVHALQHPRPHAFAAKRANSITPGKVLEDPAPMGVPQNNRIACSSDPPYTKKMRSNPCQFVLQGGETGKDGDKSLGPPVCGPS